MKVIVPLALCVTAAFFIARSGSGQQAGTVQAPPAERSPTEAAQSAQAAPVAAQAAATPADADTTSRPPGDATSQSLISAGSLEGASLLNAAGESVGSVARVALNPSLRRVHLVINVGGVLGIGAREIAIPLEAIRLRAAKDATADPQQLWLSVDATSEQLAKAPALEARDSLELTDTAWIERNAQFYGVARSDPSADDKPPAQVTALATTDVLDEPVIGQGDTATIAQLEDILFGLGSPPVEYAVLSYGGTLGIGKKHVAIPFRELTISAKPDGQWVITAPHNSKTLTEQQHVTPDQYPELKLRSVRLRIER